MTISFEVYFSEQMSLSDGRIKTFEVSIEQFHQLRYNVAKVNNYLQFRSFHPYVDVDIRCARHV